MAPLQFEILTAERRVYSDEVDMVIAPGQLGELGILPNHAPLLTPLQPGELRIKKGSEEVAIAVTGGFLEMFQNKLTVLADAAERADEIDVERAERALARAQEQVKTGASDADSGCRPCRDQAVTTKGEGSRAPSQTGWWRSAVFPGIAGIPVCLKTYRLGYSDCPSGVLRWKVKVCRDNTGSMFRTHTPSGTCGEIGA